VLPEATPAPRGAAAVADHADADAQESRSGWRSERARSAPWTAARGAAAGLRDLPGWPLLMDRATARRFTSTTRAQFDALVACGLLPPPRELLPGRRWWHREELAIRAARLFRLETQPDDQTRQQDDDEARTALARFDPRAGKAVPQGRHQQGR
jgi:hypothetical protein